MDKQAMQVLFEKRERILEDLRNVNKAIEALQTLCEHRWLHDGHDSHHSYEKCDICGKRESD